VSIEIDMLFVMSQTILIEQNIDTKNLISHTLEAFVGTEVIHQLNAEDAIGLLKILPEVRLIITRAQVGDENTALKIFNYIADQGLPISLIVLGDSEELKDDVHCLKDPLNLDTLIHHVTEYISNGTDEHPYTNQKDYIPFPLHYFYDISKAPCDVFIRIKKDAHQFKFYKRMNAKESFDRWVLERYHDNGLREFYIQNEDRKIFIEFVTEQLTAKLKRQDLNPEEMIFVTSNSHQIVRDFIHQSGLDDVSIKLSEASVNSIVTSVIYSPEVSILYKMLLSSRIPYAYQACHLQALMCHYILTKQSWYKVKHLETLSFVAFFADTSLHTQEQMQVGSMPEIYTSDLTDHEKRLVLEHAKTSLMAVEKHPMMNPYIKTVMLESHGKANGIGIEENPAESLHVLSKIFIIADNVVKILLNPEMPSTKKEILPLLYERFSNPSYQKIIKTLEQRFETTV
jgi:hypothetical protein